MIRVLLLIPTLDAAGAEKQLMLLAAGLDRERFEPHVVALTRSGPYEADLRRAGVGVDVVGKRLKCDPLAWWRLRRLIARRDPDIVHTWLFAANAYGRLAVGRSRSVIVSERCVDSWKQAWQLQLDRRLTGRTAGLIANSESVAAFYRDQGVPEKLIHVIPNGVEMPAETSPEERESVRRELGLPADARLVISVGRLARQKRLDTLLWAMQLLRQLTDNVYHIIVGEGPRRAHLEWLARHYTCDDVTRFLGPRRDVGRLLGAADLFWMASEFEGQSNSLMEAMAHRLPVIASGIPPNRELIADGQCGLLVRPGDSVAFAQYADRLLADPVWAARLGHAGRERMVRRHSIARMVESYSRLYEKIAAASSSMKS